MPIRLFNTRPAMLDLSMIPDVNGDARMLTPAGTAKDHRDYPSDVLTNPHITTLLETGWIRVETPSAESVPAEVIPEEATPTSEELPLENFPKAKHRR